MLIDKVFINNWENGILKLRIRRCFQLKFFHLISITEYLSYQLLGSKFLINANIAQCNDWRWDVWPITLKSTTY